LQYDDDCRNVVLHSYNASLPGNGAVLRELQPESPASTGSSGTLDEDEIERRVIDAGVLGLLSRQIADRAQPPARRHLLLVRERVRCERVR
jgi:hypothetical protein